MIYVANSPYYQWFLTTQKKQRSKMSMNDSAQQTGKSHGPTIRPFTEWSSHSESIVEWQVPQKCKWMSDY